MKKMCVEKIEENKSQKDNKNNLSCDMSSEIHGVVQEAKVNNRLICGLSSTVSRLEKTPEDVILCLLPSVNPGDSGTHMQNVLLQAFCYENYIPVIQVDNSRKLAQLCGSKNGNWRQCSEYFCAIVVRNEDVPFKEDEDPPMSPSEKALVDFYEKSLNFYPQPPVIHLMPPVS